MGGGVGREGEGGVKKRVRPWSSHLGVSVGDADGEVEDQDKEEALKRAVDIAPQIREELGQTWLDESFTERPERGMEILSVIGSAASRGLVQQGRDPSRRFKGLELQTTAAKGTSFGTPTREEVGLAELVRNGEVTPRELCELALDFLVFGLFAVLVLEKAKPRFFTQHHWRHLQNLWGGRVELPLA